MSTHADHQTMNAVYLIPVIGRIADPNFCYIKGCQFVNKQYRIGSMLDSAGYQ